MKKIALPLFLVIILFSFAPRSFAQAANSWALKMFSECGTAMSHNFGNIALHAEAEHRFLFKNIYKEDVEILSVQSNCSCTKASFTKKIVKSMETAEIVARIDTSGKVHTGKRKVTVTLYFSKPRVAEIQFQVESYIRPDVIFEPGVIEFGSVPKGKSITKEVTLQYNGTNPNWRIIGMKKMNSGIRAEASLTSHQNARKVYNVKITLLDKAESGNLSDLLVFTTNVNDGGGDSIFIPIHGLVLSSLTAKPSCLQFGVIPAGQSVTKNLVIRGSIPFKVENIGIADSNIKFLTADKESSVHVIPITYNAQNDDPEGEFQKTITVKTTLKNLPELNVTAYGYVQKENQSSITAVSQENENQETKEDKLSPYSLPNPERIITAYQDLSAEGPAFGIFEGFEPEVFRTEMNQKIANHTRLWEDRQKEKDSDVAVLNEEMFDTADFDTTEMNQGEIAANISASEDEFIDEETLSEDLTAEDLTAENLTLENENNEAAENEDLTNLTAANESQELLPNETEEESQIESPQETAALNLPDSSLQEEDQYSIAQSAAQLPAADELAKAEKAILETNLERQNNRINAPRERGRFFQKGSRLSLISQSFASDSDVKSLEDMTSSSNLEDTPAPKIKEDPIFKADHRGKKSELNAPQNIQKGNTLGESEKEADTFSLELPKIQDPQENPQLTEEKTTQEILVSQTKEFSSEEAEETLSIKEEPKKIQKQNEILSSASHSKQSPPDEGWTPKIKKTAKSPKTAFQFRRPVF